MPLVRLEAAQNDILTRLRKDLPDFSWKIKGGEIEGSTFAEAEHFECKLEVGVRVYFPRNKSPVGGTPGVETQIRLSDRLFSLKEAMFVEAALIKILDTLGPIRTDYQDAVVVP